MTLKVQILLIIITVTFLSGKLSAQKIEVDISACSKMYNVLSAMKSGVPKSNISTMLDTVLSTKPYKMMFKHYNRSWRPNHLPVEVFKRMILSLQFAEEYQSDKNQRADKMFSYWKNAYNDLSKYKKNLEQLSHINLDKIVSEAVKYAQSWLPPEMIIPDSYLFIHPNGGSNGFVINGSQGYDFFQIPRDSMGNFKIQEFIRIIRHEQHHLGLKDSIPGTMSTTDSTAYLFLSLFIGEGTATKFVDNAPGGCVPAVDPSGTNFFTGKLDTLWKNYTIDEQKIFDRFISTFENLYSGKMKEADLYKEINDYWLTGLKGPVYFLGSEFFGAIYYAFGKEKTFEAMRDARKILTSYNEAIKKKPDKLKNCITVPDSVVKHSIAIGSIN